MRFPSVEFDDAVAALCHGIASETQQRELTALLTASEEGRDEYLWRVELHARLASEPGLLIGAGAVAPSKIISLPQRTLPWKRVIITSAAACIAALAAFIGFRITAPDQKMPVILTASQPPVAPDPPSPEPTEADVLALNLRLQSLQARLAASEDRLRLLEMARNAQPTAPQQP
jgi:hypothetical protein